MNHQLDEQTKELIAIGASIAAHCQPCLTYHLTKARELGIDAEQIRAALDVGHMVEKGAMSAMHSFAKTAFQTPAVGGSTCCSPGTKGRCC